MALALSNEFEFRQVSRDRPFGGSSPLVESGKWLDLPHAKVRYCQPSPIGARGLREILVETPYDILLLNGFFDREFTLVALILRRVGLTPRRPTILSPRGEFSSGALQLKRAQKLTYLYMMRKTGLLNDVWLHATGPNEHQEIERAIPFSRGILTAPNVRHISPLPRVETGSSQADALRAVFLSRIDRKKNLDYAIQVLKRVRVPVQFHVFGPISDKTYWGECLRLMQDIPCHVDIQYLGDLPNALVSQRLAQYDLFFMPTRGENFGHAIFDALEAGVPVLISDQTPWQDMERRMAGWSMPLNEPEGFSTTIEAYAAATPAQRDALRLGARRCAESAIKESDAVRAAKIMFQTALADQ